MYKMNAPVSRKNDICPKHSFQTNDYLHVKLNDEIYKQQLIIK